MTITGAILDGDNSLSVKILFANMLKQFADRITGPFTTNCDLWQILEPCGPMAVAFFNDDFAECFHGSWPCTFDEFCPPELLSMNSIANLVTSKIKLVIPVKQRGNLHSLWDSLLGPKFDAGDVRRRAIEIKSDHSTWNSAGQAAKAKDGLNPLAWLDESQQYSRSHVYTPDILLAIEAAVRGSQKVEKLDLSDAYLKAAGQVARKRAAFAAQRLGKLLQEYLR